MTTTGPHDFIVGRPLLGRIRNAGVSPNMRDGTVERWTPYALTNAGSG